MIEGKFQIAQTLASLTCVIVVVVMAIQQHGTSTVHITDRSTNIRTNMVRSNNVSTIESFEQSNILVQSDPDILFRYSIPSGNVGAVFINAFVLGSDVSSLPVDQGTLYAIVSGLAARSGDTYTLKQSSTQLLQGDGTMSGTTLTWSIVNGNKLYLTKDLVGTFTTRWTLKGIAEYTTF